MTIWGFYEERFPIYTSGDQVNDLCEPVTPEELNTLVLVIALLAEWQALWFGRSLV